MKNLSKQMLRQYLPTLSLSFLLGLAGFLGSSFATTLLDQIVAQVGKEALTLRDVRLHHAVNTIMDLKHVPSARNLELREENQERARQALVESTLIAHYLVKIDPLRHPTPKNLEVTKKDFWSLFPNPKRIEVFRHKWELGQKELNHSLRLRLWRKVFLQNYLPMRVRIREDDVQKRYKEEKSRRYLGKPFEKVKNIVKADLQREAIAREFRKWFETEARRTEVLYLPLNRPVGSNGSALLP